jgi:hypothetical protein
MMDRALEATVEKDGGGRGKRRNCIGSHEAPDVLWGAAEIGRAIGKAARATFHLLEAGHLPARKIGGQWCASRRKLLEALIGDDGAGNE